MAKIVELQENLKLSNTVLWDLGPANPGDPPKPPAAPKGQPGEPAYDVAMVTFKPALVAFTAAHKEWERATAEYTKWVDEFGGPFEIHGYPSIDAKDAIHNGRCRKCRDCKDWEARKGTGRVGSYANCLHSRYQVSAATRGHGDKPNRGLPEGVKPGQWHDLNMQRIAAGNDDAMHMRRQDPVFGEEYRP